MKRSTDSGCGLRALPSVLLATHRCSLRGRGIVGPASYLGVSFLGCFIDCVYLTAWSYGISYDTISRPPLSLRKIGDRPLSGLGDEVGRKNLPDIDVDTGVLHVGSEWLPWCSVF